MEREGWIPRVEPFFKTKHLEELEIVGRLLALDTVEYPFKELLRTNISAYDNTRASENALCGTLPTHT